MPLLSPPSLPPRLAGVLLGSLAAATLTTLLVPTSAHAEEEPEYAAQHVLVSWLGAQGSSEAKRTKEEARARAEEALKEATAPGAVFASVSSKFSDDKVSGIQGGFLGIFGPRAMVPVFEEAVVKLKPGEFAPIVESPFGYHVIQRLTLEDALQRMTATTRCFVAVAFAYQGSKDPTAQRTKEAALADAEKAVAALRAGTTFAALPPELAGQPLSRGWMPITLRRGQTKPEFQVIEDAVFAAEPGGVSAPFDTVLGYIVVQRTPWWRARLQHFLVMHQGSSRVPAGITRTKAQAEARAAEAHKKLLADPSVWAQLVKEYSDEPGAAEREGSLGAVEPGRMVPEFDAVVGLLAPGAISAVFETQFGFHVVRRTR